MTKIKIISNPYQKQIDYQIYDESESEWTDIRNPEYAGKLRADKLIHGFFPFNVKEIVDDIIDEFEDSREKIQLYFEGTPDEYADLAAVCREPDVSEKMDLQPAVKSMNNAWEILPNVTDLFDHRVRPLMEESISADSPVRQALEEDLAKFSDASGDVIPICVIGNYSAGKSTFINALIGNEILPSGDKAVTARIYEIYQSKDQTAKICFTLAGNVIELNVTDDRCSWSDAGEKNELTDHMDRELAAIQEPGFTVRINRALAMLNKYAGSDGNTIGDMIEIHIPFRKGLWDQFSGKFVILDTPGSNAASHADHREVLTEAMHGMSNGIPVYVVEYDSLDSTDNETLYDLVKKMEGLDPRFTMIVVNKADGANLPKDNFSEEEKDIILHEAIPKNLYSSGIYFVSAVLGLGSKNGGKFIDNHSAETYDLYKDKYADPSSRHYKELYRYDIMPEQIKPDVMEAAQKKAGEDPLFANSGLYSVEQAIQTFSVKYASYNKCQQSRLFLGKVIDLTREELEKATQEREKNKAEMEDKLEHDKQELIANVEGSAQQELAVYQDAYDENMRPVVDKAKESYTVEALKEKEAQFTEDHQKNLDIEALKDDAKKQTADVGDAFRTGFQKLGKSFNIQSIREFGNSIVKETREAIDSKKALFNTSREADRAAADDLIRETNHDFCVQAENADKELDRAAQIYWNGCSVTFREKLAEIVKNTSLSEEKKTEITDLITAYHQLEFDSVENGEIFKVDEFDYLLKFGDLKLFKMDKLFLSRLSMVYKARLSDTVDKIGKNILDAYQNSFISWEENLVNVVRTNIVDYSPELREQQKKINEETERIHELQNRQSRLQVYVEDLQTMLDWKEASIS